MNWSRQGIIDSLQEWTATYGEPPRRQDWTYADRPGGYPSAFKVCTEFGTWNAALEAAGLPTRPARARRRWSKPEIIGALQAEAQATGKTPTYEGWKRANEIRPTANTVLRHFGSWRAGLRAAGLA